MTSHYNRSPRKVISPICPFSCHISQFSRISDVLCRQVMDKVSTLHLNFECPHRMIKCELCGVSIKARDSTYHLMNSCEYRQTNCPNVGCDQSMCLIDVQQHLKLSCPCRMTHCLLGCDEILPIKIQSQHNSVCLNRIVRCPNNCGHEVVFIDLPLHTAKSCPMVRTGL